MPLVLLTCACRGLSYSYLVFVIDTLLLLGALEIFGGALFLGCSMVSFCLDFFSSFHIGLCR